MAVECETCGVLQECAQDLPGSEDVQRVMAQHLELHVARARLRQAGDELEHARAESRRLEAEIAKYTGGMCVPPWTVMQLVHEWFQRVGEWPHSWQVHEQVAERAACPLEVAAYDTLNALNAGYVYGLPSVVAMRLGEAVGDWRGPLPLRDNGFRIAVRADTQEMIT